MINPELKKLLEVQEGEVVLRPVGRLATIGGMVKMNQLADDKSGVTYHSMAATIQGKGEDLVRFFTRLADLFAPSDSPDLTFGEMALPFYSRKVV